MSTPPKQQTIFLTVQFTNLLPVPLTAVPEETKFTTPIQATWSTPPPATIGTGNVDRVIATRPINLQGQIVYGVDIDNVIYSITFTFDKHVLYPNRPTYTCSVSKGLDLEKPGTKPDPPFTATMDQTGGRGVKAYVAIIIQLITS